MEQNVASAAHGSVTAWTETAPWWLQLGVSIGLIAMAGGLRGWGDKSDNEFLEIASWILAILGIIMLYNVAIK